MAGLDRLLAALDVTVGSFAISDVGPGRNARIEASDDTRALYVLAGSGRLRSSDSFDVALSVDTLLVLPRDAPFELEPAPDAAARLVIVCGGVVATFAGAGNLFEALNTPLVESFADQPLRDDFLMLTDELASPSVGSRALTECILKRALILTMRRQSLSAAPHPMIRALVDHRLAPALAAMLDRPSAPLSLEDLARLAGMSRSVFAERFTAAFGRPPIEFLKGLRLNHAARLLTTTDLPIKRIAQSVGYESRSYFSRAFRARYDADPSDYRSAAAVDLAPGAAMPLPPVQMPLNQLKPLSSQ